MLFKGSGKWMVEWEDFNKWGITMKKTIGSLVVLITVSLLITGCGGKSGGDDDSVELSLYSTMQYDNEKKVFDEVIADFEEENPNIEIDANYPGHDYEELLRVKMGANDMPDLFDTHGWATSRYNEYTEDLQDMDWADDLAPELEPIITDDDGKLSTYPLNQAKDGILFNENILDEYGIEPPETFDEFMDALYTVKDKSDGDVVPLWIAGKDAENFAQYFDQFATPLLVTDDEENYQDELLEGSFDWSNYTFLPEKLKEMQDEDLLNEDALTADQSQAVQLFSEGDIAFSVMGGTVGTDVTEANPDVKLGIIPMPAIHDGDDPSWIGGERYTMSAWKDSDHKEEAKQFIDYISQPENAEKIAESTSYPGALTNADVDNYYNKYYDDLFEDVPLEPYFDREYLPEGMFDVLGNTGQDLISDNLTPEQVSEEMKDEYNRLMKE